MELHRVYLGYTHAIAGIARNAWKVAGKSLRKVFMYFAK